MRTFIIGAGASKAYSESPTNCRMPIANDFFQTFNKLNIKQWAAEDRPRESTCRGYYKYM